MFKEYTLVLLKPDCYEKHLRDVVLQEFKDNGLKLIHNKSVTLTRKDMIGYQPFLDEEDTGEDNSWKPKMIKRYTSRPLDIFLFEGEDVLDKTLALKTEIREQHIKEFTGEKLRYIMDNILHSPSNLQDLIRDIKVLMPEKLHLLTPGLKSKNRIIPNKQKPNFIAN